MKLLPKILLLLAIITTSTAVAGNSITFGLYSTDRATVMVRQFAPLLRELELKLSNRLKTSITIKLDISRTYQEGRSKIITGSVGFMRLGAASYVLVKQAEPGIQLLAVELKKGKKSFDGIIAVDEKSTLKSIADLQGHSFGFGNQSSTIGRYLSQQYLMNHGIRSANLSFYHYLDRHDQVGYAIARGYVDAGAFKQSTYTQLNKKLKKKGRGLRVLGRFPVPTKPWISRKGLPPKIRAALQATLHAMQTEDGKTPLFTSGSDDDFTAVRQAIRNNPEFFVK